MTNHGPQLHPHSSLVAPGSAPYGAAGYGMPSQTTLMNGRMESLSHARHEQHAHQTPFQQRSDPSQQHLSSNNQYNNGFGKVRSGQTLADSRDSWRSDSMSWRSGGANPQSSNTWRTNSGSGWKDASEQRGGQNSQQGQQGYHTYGNQANSMMSTLSLNGRSSGATQERQGSTMPATFGPGGGRHGKMPFGPSKALHRYSTETLAKLYRQLLYTGRLGLPEGVQRDEPMLFTSAGEFVDVVEQLQGVARRPKNAYIDISSFYPSRENSVEVMGSGMGSRQQSQVIVGTSNIQQPRLQVPHQVLSGPAFPTSLEPSDMYTYIDPQGQWQGPFSRAEMLEWHAAGFFPMTLVVKSASGSQVARLSDWLAAWNGSSPVSLQILQQHVAVPAQSQPVPQQVQVQRQEAPAPVPSPAPAANPSFGTANEMNQQVGYNMVDNMVQMDQRRVERMEKVEKTVEKEHEAQQQEPKGELLAPVADTPQTAPEAPWSGSQSIDSAVSLRDIQQEEDARKAEIDEVRAKAKAQQQMLRSGPSGWASVARTESLSLADIQNEEMRVSSQRSAKEAAIAAATLEKQQQKIANGGMWAAAAASKPAQAPVSPANTAPRRSSHGMVVPPPPPPMENPVASPAIAAQDVASTPIDAVAFGLETPPSEQGALSGEFREWCSQQMQSLTGSNEVTLCEFLMGVESNSEIADYIRMYLGTTAAVATFSAEFIKRKLAVMAAREITAGGKKKSRKARAKANKALASVSAGTDKNTATNTAADDSSWEKVAKGGKVLGTADKASSSNANKNRPAGFALLSGRP